ncbi:hypothetical protein BOX15_Mlig005060g3, partial [Macrostomum lignano]
RVFTCGFRHKSSQGWDFTRRITRRKLILLEPRTGALRMATAQANEPPMSRPSTGRSSTMQAWETGLENPNVLDTEPIAVRGQSAGGHRQLDADGKDGDGDGKSGCGCLKSCKHGLQSIWRTRDTQDTKEDRELYIKTTLRELIIYCIFIIVLMIITFGMTSSTMYYYTKVLSDLFLDTKIENTTNNYRSVGNMGDWWSFVNGPLMNGLYWDTWYNSANFSDPREKNFIYYENKLLGVPRLRQLRVSNQSCNIASYFQGKISTCYAKYSYGVTDKSSFGLGNSTAWQYRSEEQLDGRSHNAEISSYDGGGFAVELSRDKATTQAILKELYSKLWVNRGTRAVFIDFTLYNANINLFCVIRLVTEFMATGGCLPTWDLRTVKLLRYVEPMDYFILACECVFMLFILYYIVEEALEIKKHKWRYFRCFWNCLDILVIVISTVCAAFNVYRTVAVGQKLTTLLQDENNFPDFDFLSYWQQQFNHGIAITVFFAWVKIFKYISFNKTMTQLSSTLGACAKDLMGFAIMFFIVFFAFAQLGYLIFGTQVKDFREFQQSVFTLFRIILGDFDFNSLQTANRVLGPIFFILYVFFVFFVLINMFLAIINDTYSQVKSDLSMQQNEFEMTDYFKQRASRMLSKLNLRRDKIVDIQKAIQSADLNNDKQLDFEEWRAELKQRGYADGEIEALFAKFDLDGDRVLNEEEQRQMHLELEGQRENLDQMINSKQAANEELEPDDEDEMEADGDALPAAATAASTRTSGGGGRGRGGGRKLVSPAEFQVLVKRVDRVEMSIGDIVQKIDSVLLKLELMERAKLRRREAMTRVLDALSGMEGAGSDEAERSRRAEELMRAELERWDVDTATAAASSGLGRGADSARGSRELRSASSTSRK